MSASCIFDITTVHDPDAMARDRAAVTDTVASHEGRSLAIDGPWQVTEGDGHPSGTVIIGFPSMRHADDWYRSSDHADLLERRTAATDAVLVEAVGARS